MADEVRQEIKDRHSLLKAYMHCRGMQEFTHSGYKVTWKPITYRTLDVKAFAEACPELAERFTVEIEQRRFKVAAAPSNTHRD